MANFNYQGNIKYVDGKDTWVELSFYDYVGTLQDDIESISVTGPSGLITDSKSDFKFYEDYNYICFILFNQTLELGDYSFSVTISGETVEDSHTQSVNRDMPKVSTDNMIPSSGSSVASPVDFSWDAVPDPGYSIYYGVQVREADSINYHVNDRTITGTTYNAVLAAGSYEWQVIVMDADTWDLINNRSNSGWVPFSVS